MNDPLVAVDIGNTRLQFGRSQTNDRAGIPLWEDLECAETASFNPDILRVWLPSRPLRWRVASVHRPTEIALSEWLRRSRPQDHYQLLSHDVLPLQIDVERPERVGMDRLVAAVAANRLRTPDQAAIVVDAGTAITVDAVSREGVFRGGVIMPGLRMAARALAAGTDLLPSVDVRFADASPTVIGRSTQAAIRSGVFWGTLGAIRQLVTRFAEQLGGPTQLLVTGGDAELLARLLGDDAQHAPHLVLAGIVWSAP